MNTEDIIEELHSLKCRILETMADIPEGFEISTVDVWSRFENKVAALRRHHEDLRSQFPENILLMEDGLNFENYVRDAKKEIAFAMANAF
jgi:hypothetical protein